MGSPSPQLRLSRRRRRVDFNGSDGLPVGNGSDGGGMHSGTNLHRCVLFFLFLSFLRMLISSSHISIRRQYPGLYAAVLLAPFSPSLTDFSLPRPSSFLVSVATCLRTMQRLPLRYPPLSDGGTGVDAGVFGCSVDISTTKQETDWWNGVGETNYFVPYAGSCRLAGLGYGKHTIQYVNSPCSSFFFAFLAR